MDDEAFHALNAINRGETALQNPAQQRWLQAFATVKWTQVTDEGVALTSDGLAALNEMRVDRRPGARRRDP